MYPSSHRWIATASVVAIAVFCGGCGKFDPSGMYGGTVAQTGEMTIALTDLAQDGTMTADVKHINDTKGGAELAVTRLENGQIEIDLGGGCRFRLDQSPPPNETNYTISIKPEQECEIAVEGIDARVFLSGIADFTKDRQPGIELSLYGTEQRGEPGFAGFTNVTYSLSFYGVRQK